MQVYMHKNKTECDFIIEDKQRIISAVQVCYNLDVNNKKREMRGAITAMDHYNLDSSCILTYNQSETETLTDGRVIIIMPVWKWLIT